MYSLDWLIAHPGKPSRVVWGLQALDWFKRCDHLSIDMSEYIDVFLNGDETPPCGYIVEFLRQCKQDIVSSRRANATILCEENDRKYAESIADLVNLAGMHTTILSFSNYRSKEEICRTDTLALRSGLCILCFGVNSDCYPQVMSQGFAISCGIFRGILGEDGCIEAYLDSDRAKLREYITSYMKYMALGRNFGAN